MLSQFIRESRSRNCDNNCRSRSQSPNGDYRRKLAIVITINNFSNGDRKRPPLTIEKIIFAERRLSQLPYGDQKIIVASRKISFSENSKNSETVKTVKQ